jgi:S1-C subfamily serine protease
MSYAITSTIAYTEQINQYNYSAFLFIPIPYENREDYTPGIAVSELSQHDREIYQQNTGALINIVYKNTTAYYANLIHGDIITNINGKRINSPEDYFDVLEKSKIGDIWNITFVRNGQERHVEIPFKL